MELSPCNEKLFPLESLLQIYIRAQTGKYSLYVDHFYGLKLLLAWLGPLSVPTIKSCQVYWFESSYETQRIAELCGTTEYIVLYTLRKIYYERNDR